jgi:hypothetical protein
LALLTPQEHFPRMVRVRQKFPPSGPVDILGTLSEQFSAQGILAGLKPAGRVAIAVGSRGITDLRALVSSVVMILRKAQAEPFIVPAMGSHGGATAEGQSEILASYGISEEQMGIPVRPAMDTVVLGNTQDGIDVHFSAEALDADAVVVINRIKPHTDFGGPFGSGLMKMMAIGLGKRRGATTCHLATSRFGYEHVIRTVARVTLSSVPILCGIAVIENQVHQIAKLVILTPQTIETNEAELLKEARSLMPMLPFAEIDLLIVDRIGKNISGVGMDPNVIGRSVHGYSSSLIEKKQQPPIISRIFVRDLTPETHGNAIGIGLADFTTDRLVHSIDKQATCINALTALTPQTVKIPIHFQTDREAIASSLSSLALPDLSRARVVRIADTQTLEELEVSEAYLDIIPERPDLAVSGQVEPMTFDPSDNLSSRLY